LPELLTITINGHEVQVKSGTVVSAALLTVGTPCRRSVTGQLRTALCGMGICFECRATVDGVAHRRTCQLLCHSGMVVETR
jgi:D-hydroxyproline dehydrogenase subunit gamma